MNDKYTEVLPQYALDVTAVRKGRGAWICETGQGVKLLKEYKGTQKRLEFEDQVLEQVRDQGYPWVERYLKNLSGELVSAGDDGTRYIMKDWFDDRECNLKDQKEIIMAVSEIARLHRIFQRIEFRDEWNLGSILARPVDEEMERHNVELQRARNYIRKKRHKSEFELCVIQSYQEFYDQALQAREGMGKLYSDMEGAPLALCHGDLDQHHMLMGSGYIAITEFNKMHLGMQMDDLYHFMRKVMEKHNWNMNIGLTMIEAYDRILSLSKKDLECLYYLFLYPEKYWKQINFYFNANKAWVPARNIEKLRNLEEQQGDKNSFLSKIN